MPPANCETVVVLHEGVKTRSSAGINNRK
jgi:hypothetical protein